MSSTNNGVYVKSGNCPLCDFPLDDMGDCTNSECDSNLMSEEEWRDNIENNVDDPYETYNDEDDDSDEEEELTVD